MGSRETNRTLDVSIGLAVHFSWTKGNSRNVTNEWIIISSTFACALIWWILLFVSYSIFQNWATENASFNFPVAWVTLSPSRSFTFDQNRFRAENLCFLILRREKNSWRDDDTVSLWLSRKNRHIKWKISNANVYVHCSNVRIVSDCVRVHVCERIVTFVWFWYEVGGGSIWQRIATRRDIRSILSFITRSSWHLNLNMPFIALWEYFHFFLREHRCLHITCRAWLDLDTDWRNREYDSKWYTINLWWWVIGIAII